MGLFDMFKESEEDKARKDAQFREQQEILARRRNPAAMEAYEAEVAERRAELLNQDAELKELQKTGDIAAWEQLRAEGKLKRCAAGSRWVIALPLLTQRYRDRYPPLQLG